MKVEISNKGGNPEVRPNVPKQFLIDTINNGKGRDLLSDMIGNAQFRHRSCHDVLHRGSSNIHY